MKFSVLLSVYQKESPFFLALSLESIFSQTLAPDEVLIVEDGPLTEELSEVISSFKANYEVIKVVTLPENVGLGRALRTGLEQCRYDIIARMDSDDICYPERFEKQITFLKSEPSVSVVGSSIQEFSKDPGDLNRFRRLPASSEDLVRFAKYRNPLNHPSVMFRREDVLQSGSYKQMPLFEDYYLWVRMIQRGCMLYNLPEPLLHFRVGNDMIGRRHGTSYLKKEVRFLRAIKKLGFINNREFYLSLISKLPLRLLPKRQLEWIYKKILR